jgi:hypothetical protein
MHQGYWIEQIDYDLISQALDLSPYQKSVLFGYYHKYIAVKAEPERKGLQVIFKTLGKRDECAIFLREFLKKESYARGEEGEQLRKALYLY